MFYSVILAAPNPDLSSVTSADIQTIASAVVQVLNTNVGSTNNSTTSGLSDSTTSNGNPTSTTPTEGLNELLTTLQSATTALSTELETPTPSASPPTANSDQKKSGAPQLVQMTVLIGFSLIN